jgi:hypothetical protein
MSDLRRSPSLTPATPPTADVAAPTVDVTGAVRSGSGRTGGKVAVGNRSWAPTPGIHSRAQSATVAKAPRAGPRLDTMIRELVGTVRNSFTPLTMLASPGPALRLDAGQ